jgi:hypothetical protein
LLEQIVQTAVTEKRGSRYQVNVGVASRVRHFFDFVTGAYHGARSTFTGLPEASAKPAPIDYNKAGALDFVTYANGTWYFYTANGPVNKSIATGSPSTIVPMSRRFLP